MKRYLFLKLGLTILVFAAASPRSQVSESYSSIRESRRISSNNNQNSQNVEQSTVFSSQRRDTNTPVPDYQGVMGKPGVDFPVLKFIPRTKFTCRGKKSGYYADLETNCQVFHICDEGRKVSFLCPNGTIFQQSDLICDWWFKVDCASSPTLYEESAEQLNEENRRRKENRKVQHQHQERKSSNNNKKDVNEYTSIQHHQQNYYEKTNGNNEEYNNYNKETQIPSESASFVSSRYNNQQRFEKLKSLNLNDVKPYPSATEKSNNNRGARTFNNNKVQYRNQVVEEMRTTTQHTIYSPTVPPFTSTSRLTTKAPAAFKARQGFYITKEPTENSVTPTHKLNELKYLPNEKVMAMTTPKPTQPTDATMGPTVTDNVNNMIRTLEEIEGGDRGGNARPGLNIPPSAGPKTLHSLAIYFATALDNLVANETATTDANESHVTLLSRMTQDKYNLLFDENQETTTTTVEKVEEQSTDISLRSLVENESQLNDLDGEQSRGPVSIGSSTPRIRQLAQVFTQALSAYLDDPDTFKKVLEEIRPTEPPLTITTEFKSYNTKEEDEVLDFSDADKSSTYKPFVDNNIRTTTTEVQSKSIPTPNPLALDLNNGLTVSTASGSGLLQDLEDSSASVEGNTESDNYFPFSTGEDEQDAKRKATAKPYGFGVTMTSTPAPVSLSLSLSGDEYLQSAHSQSFVSHNLIKDRQGKSLPVQQAQKTTELFGETTTYIDTSTLPDDSTTITENYSTTEESTTVSRTVPNDHWSTSPEVTKLWESTLYVDPQLINRNLGASTQSLTNEDTEITTYRPEFSTQPYRTTTTSEYLTETETETETEIETEEPTSTTTDLNEYYSTTVTVIDLGIHSLLNSSELEIAHSQAQQIFGNLNSTEQDRLIEKMKEAESNSTVRRLILLLVSTCDASLSNNKTVQQTRNSILHALLNSNSNDDDDEGQLKSRSGKQLLIDTQTTTSKPEETTASDAQLIKIRSKIETQNKVARGVDVHQDTRALELLRSLYSLAAKWGKK